MDIMAVHPIKLTRIAMKALLGKNKKGVVCITASVAGYTPIYPLPLYSASKHAVIGFTRSMTEAAQVQGVKVVAICPA
jgi:NAD(P)-dependent dehydrogenase (short-subunit alcohol dehydrogenase family)